MTGLSEFLRDQFKIEDTYDFVMAFEAPKRFNKKQFLVRPGNIMSS